MMADVRMHCYIASEDVDFECEGISMRKIQDLCDEWKEFYNDLVVIVQSASTLSSNDFECGQCTYRPLKTIEIARSVLYVVII